MLPRYACKRAHRTHLDTWTRLKDVLCVSSVDLGIVQEGHNGHGALLYACVSRPKVADMRQT